MGNISTKLTSARFWMAIIMTTAGCYVAGKHFDKVGGEFFILWGIIIRDYFSRTDRDKNA